VRLHNVRSQGKGCFLTLRQKYSTVQAVLFAGGAVSKEMVAYAANIPKESFVEIFGEVTRSPAPVESATQKEVELQVQRIFTVSKAAPTLPFQVRACGCGRVDVWTCGRVDVWTCGRVDVSVWTCGRVCVDVSLRQ
jgi:aspartyl/asparaginyl-tRNA synthetase